MNRIAANIIHDTIEKWGEMMMSMHVHDCNIVARTHIHTQEIDRDIFMR